MTTQSAPSGSSVLHDGHCFSFTSFIGRGQSALPARSRRGLAWVPAALLLSVVMVFGAFGASAGAQQINYVSFSGPQAAPSSPFSNSCPAGTNILFCANYVGAGVSFIQDFYPASIDPNAATDGGAGSTNYALQLTQNAASQNSSVWFATPQDVVDGFTTWYAVKINYQGGGDGNTADGLAFVIQNASGGKTDSISTCAETGSGPTVLGTGGGCLGYGGIDNSVALEMDTFYSSWDPQQSSRGTSYSDNHLALQSCGLDGNGNPIANSPTHTTSPNCLITLSNGTSTLITSPVTSVAPTSVSSSVLLSDGNPHQIVMVYNGPNDSPANYLSVYLDATYNPGTHTPVAGSVPMFSGPFDITKYMKLSNGSGPYSPAYVGFTAATGGDYEQHEVMAWTFSPHANQPNFGNVTVCPSGQTTPAPCNETLAYTYKFPGGANLGQPQVVTQGTPGLDFTLAGTTCTGIVPSGGSCTVSVTFAPLAPGPRMGAVNVVSSTGVLLASTLIYGTGQGPAAVIAPGTQSVVLTGNLALAQPRGIVVDAAGDIFIADNTNRRVLKVATNGTVTTVGPALSFPSALAVDGAGNLFVSTQTSTQNTVVKIPVGCASSACESTVGAGLSLVGGVTVDGAGDVFLNDITNNDIVKVPAGCASSACQSVVYGPIPGSSPGNIAVDAAGDLFIPDYALRAVIEVPAGCATASCQLQIGQGWIAPLSAAVDAAGDVFVTDSTSVVEVPAGCTSGCQTTVVSNINPYGVAVDGQGNIFVSDTLYNHVIEVNRAQPPSVSFAPANVGTTGSPIPFTFQNIGNQPLTAGSPALITVNGPNFVSVPGSGTPVDCSASSTVAPGAACNLSLSFNPQAGGPLASTAVFSDNALNATTATQSIALSGTGLVPIFALSISTLGGSAGGTGVVTDLSGQISCSAVSVGQAGTCSGNYASGTQITLTAVANGSSVFTGWGGACASAGTSSTCNVIITQASSVTASFVNQNLGSYNVCPAGQAVAGPCSNLAPVTFNLAATTTIGAIQVVTQGATGLDFSQGSGSTCVGTIPGGNSCVVNVNFKPIAPGLRMGAVQLYDNNANLVASAPIYGIGQGPVAAFSPGTQATLSATLPSGANGVAVDAAGNVFIADIGGAYKLTPSGVQSMFPVVGVGATGFYDVALDGAGDVFLADSNNNRVIEITPSGVQTVVPASGLSFPSGVKVDGPGNLFIADRDNNRVLKISPSGVQTTVPTTGLVRPYYLAVDAAGDVFFLDNGSQRVLKVTPAGVQSTVPFTGLVAINGLAVDAAGDVFASDQALNKVFELTPGGVQTTAASSGLIVPAGLAVDAAGNLFIAVHGQNQVAVVIRSQAPSLSFTQTNVGSTSTDSPQSFSLQNVGNQPLTGSLALNLGANFTQNNPLDCSSLIPLVPGASCGESFSFTPQSATFLSGTAVFTDNNLNSSSVTQTITLSGTGAVGGVAGLVAVPNVVGQVQSATTTPITGAGLAMGTVSTASSQTVASGTVISQSPAAGTQVAVGTAVNLLVSTGLPLPGAPNPLSLENNYFVTGDYVSAGIPLRTNGTGNIIIQSYAQNASNGVPDGADVVDAYLYWETLESTPFASSTSGTFNGYPIVGQQIGNDLPNFTDGQLTGTIRSYRAAVNAYLPVGANGVRIVSGSYSVSLPSGGAALPLTEGASLVMVYRVLSPNFPLKSIVLYDGAALPAVTGTQVVQGFYDAVGGANGTGKSTNIYTANGGWNTSAGSVTLGKSNQYSAPLNVGSAYAAVILSTPVNNSDNDGILDAWKTGPAGSDFHAGQPGYYDAKTATWVGLPGAKHGQKDLFVQLDYMCGAVLANGSCDTTKENLFPSPDTSGNDPLVMVQQAFANSGVQLHLQIGNIVPEDTCVDSTQLCQFPNQPGVVGWKNSLEFSKLYPRNLYACITGGDCTTRFPYGQKDSYHYVLMGHSLAIPAWNSRYGTLTSIKVVSGVTTIGTVDRGAGINACPSRITLGGVIGNPSLNGVYNTLSCADTKTITVLTPGVPNWSYPNTTLAEPVIGLTSGTTTSISGYSDLGGADSAVTLGPWLTAKNQDMSKKANVLAGTIFHEIGHTLGLSHGGLYYDTPNSYVPTFDANCKPNYQSVMNYLFQLDLVGPNQTLAFSNQTLNTLNENAAGSVIQLTDGSGNPATFPTSAWYVPYTGPPASPATRHCDGTPLIGDAAYRVDAPIAPITPAWSNGQDLSFIGALQSAERGFNDLTNMDLRQVGATGGEFASLASVLSFGASVAPLNIGANGNVTLGSGGTVSLGSGGTVTLGSGGNVTLGSGGTITLGSGGNVTLGSGGNVTLGSGGTITLGSGGTVTLGSGGNATLGSAGTITLGSGGTITLGSGGNVTLGSGGTITSGSGGTTITVPSSGGTYSIDGSGGTITLGSGGNVTLGSGGNVTLGSGGTITLGSGGTITLGSGGNVTLGSGGTITLGSGGTVTLGSGGNVTLGSGGTVTLGSGGNLTPGSSGGNVTLGSGGEATLAAGGTITLGSGGNVTLGSGGNVTLGSGGTITLGSGGNVTLGSGGNATLGSGGTITLGSGGTITLGSGGTVTLGSGGTITLGSGGVTTVPAGGGTYSVGAGGTITLGSGGNVTLGSGGNITLGSGGTITLGSGGNITLGSGGNVTLGSGGTITLGSGGTITLGSGGNVTLGSGGVVTLGNGGNVIVGSGSTIGLGSVNNISTTSGGPLADNELTYETANSVVRPPSLPTETTTPAGVRINWRAPAFGVVQTYTIYRSSNGATPIVIGSVSGVNGNPPATEFTDTNPDTLSATVVYTVTTTLVPDTTGPSRQSVPSPPAVLKNDQSIVLGPLPSSVIVQNPVTVTATAMSNGSPNGLQVAFSTTGSCTIGSQSIASGVSSAVVTSSIAGNCTVTAAQPGTTSYNAANSVSGIFTVLAQGSATKSQTITFPLLPNAQYGGSFTLSATSSAGLPVSFTASGPCTTSGSISGMGVCSITASAPAANGYSAASLTQSFTIYPAVLKVTANNLATPYGQPLPSLTYTYSGFVTGSTSSVDTASVVSGAPALSTTATAASNAGSYPITVSTGTLATTNYSFLYVTGTLTVQPANQAALILKTVSPLTFNQSETLSVTGGTTGGTVSYNLVSGPCALSGNKLTANSGTGSCLVTATMAGNGNYNSVSSTPASSVGLGLASQTITFSTNPPANAAYGSSFVVAATAGSGGMVTFTNAGVCSNSAATFTMTNSTGTCSVIANQAGNANYATAPQITKTVSATPGTLLIAPTSGNFGSIQVGKTSPAISFSVTNYTASRMGYLGYSNLGEFYLQPGTCHLVNGEPMLNPGQSCVFTAVFRPTKAGPVTGSLAIQTSSGTFNVPMTGTGAGLLITPAFGNFGSVQVGKTSSAMSFSVTNYTTSTTAYLGYTNLGEFYLQPGTCHVVSGQSMLSPGQSCVFTAVFKPTKAGPVIGYLSIQTSSGTYIVPMTGTGSKP